jgi:hypothetical protein
MDIRRLHQLSVSTDNVFKAGKILYADTETLRPDQTFPCHSGDDPGKFLRDRPQQGCQLV